MIYYLLHFTPQSSCHLSRSRFRMCPMIFVGQTQACQYDDKRSCDQQTQFHMVPLRLQSSQCRGELEGFMGSTCGSIAEFLKNLQTDRAKNDKYKIYQKQKQIKQIKILQIHHNQRQISNLTVNVNNDLKTSPCRVDYPGFLGLANFIV